MENHHNNRLYGLDTLRAIAIIIVLIYHYKVVVSSENIFGFMSQLGWAGVDLFFFFFCYLIGNQVLSAIAKGQAFSLKLFYIRRFLRTLPNYYFVLALYYIFLGALELGAALIVGLEAQPAHAARLVALYDLHPTPRLAARHRVFTRLVAVH